MRQYAQHLISDVQTRPLKLLGLGGLLDSFTDDDEEVLGQNEGNALPLVPKLLLLVIDPESDRSRCGKAGGRGEEKEEEEDELG